MAAVMLNAASMAYRKASANARDATKVDPNTAPWIKYIASVFPEDDTDLAPIALIEANHHRKERLFANSNDYYEKFAWFIYSNITSTTWFEIFILFNIVIVGVSTGVELENQGRDEWTNVIGYYIGDITLSVFTLECILKLIAEAYEPWRYFTNPEFGMFNTFDFLIVVLSFSFMETGGNAISALRMIRLLRLLSFIKHVPHLRVLVNGLIQGVKSVAYIVLMLFLVIYIFAIFGANVFGANDPGHFGDTAVSMMTLFQVSTLGSWSSIAYISWFGCEGYLDSAYSSENPSRIKTYAGTFEGYKCDVNIPNSSVTCIFWPLYILLTSWVIMSLFIGVISRGMFSTYIGMVNENHATSYLKHHEENTMSEKESRILHGGKPTTLKDKIELIFDKNVLKYQHNKKYMFLNDTLSQYYNQLVLNCIAIRNSSYFSLSITFTILLVGGVTCIQTNDTLSCQRRIDRIHAHHSNNDDDDDVDWKNKSHDCEQIPDYLYFIGLISQLIFTFEAFIKITAEGVHPKQYFTDKEDGYWNCIDFFIVIVGFVELTPFGFIFEHFPIVLLRLLRLLRVFRLAKTLPRLRSIVEALMKAFSSVGFICVLFLVFNYIAACMCIILFRDNDPFHFGTVGRAMFTIFRIETLDLGGIVLYIQVFGCAKYPNAYPFVVDEIDHMRCTDSYAMGWIGAVLLFSITIIGSYILPIVLIGIVSIKFNEARSYALVMDAERKQLSFHLKQAKSELPDFFSTARVALIQDVFNQLDSSGGKNLDTNEIAPFIHYIFDYLFEIEMTPSQFESVFYLSNSCLSSEIGMGEFVQLIKVLKKMHNTSMLDSHFAYKFNKLNSKITFSFNGMKLNNPNTTPTIYERLNSSSEMKDDNDASSEKERDHVKISSASSTTSTTSTLSDTTLKNETDLLMKHSSNKSKNHSNSNDNSGNIVQSILNTISNSFSRDRSNSNSKNKNNSNYHMTISKNYKSKWDAAMKRVDQASLDTAWDSILHSINGIEEGNTMKDKVNILFKDFDSDGTNNLDLSELGAGLKSCGIRLNDRQIKTLVKTIDIDGDGSISFIEFAMEINKVKHERARLADLKDREKIESLLNKLSPQEAQELNLNKKRKSRILRTMSADLSPYNNQHQNKLDSNLSSKDLGLSYDEKRKIELELICERSRLLNETVKLRKEIASLDHSYHFNEQQYKKETQLRFNNDDVHHDDDDDNHSVLSKRTNHHHNLYGDVMGVIFNTDPSSFMPSFETNNISTPSFMKLDYFTSLSSPMTMSDFYSFPKTDASDKSQKSSNSSHHHSNHHKDDDETMTTVSSQSSTHFKNMHQTSQTSHNGFSGFNFFGGGGGGGDFFGGFNRRQSRSIETLDSSLNQKEERKEEQEEVIGKNKDKKLQGPSHSYSHGYQIGNHNQFHENKVVVVESISEENEENDDKLIEEQIEEKDLLDFDLFSITPEKDKEKKKTKEQEEEEEEENRKRRFIVNISKETDVDEIESSQRRLVNISKETDFNESMDQRLSSDKLAAGGGGGGKENNHNRSDFVESDSRGVSTDSQTYVRPIPSKNSSSISQASPSSKTTPSLQNTKQHDEIGMILKKPSLVMEPSPDKNKVEYL